ncbi:hypothetical protein I4U23_031558 [Adineta vaga]|nr:hypothetical protein I4U23_031558 [Adineta vaga]
MFAQPIVHNNLNVDYHNFGLGNYGYGIYTQDSRIYRNPLNGYLGIEQEVDFIPLDTFHIQPYTAIPASIRQHFII